MARKSFWVDNPVNLAVPSNSQASMSLFQGTPPINTRGTTIIRTIVDLNFASETVAGAFGVNAMDLAFGMASQEAFNASVFPDPSADERPVSGWLFRTRCVVSQNGVGTAILHPCQRDLKGGRKVYDGEYFLIAENSALIGTTAAYRAVGMIRVLLLLP